MRRSLQITLIAVICGFIFSACSDDSSQKKDQQKEDQSAEEHAAHAEMDMGTGEASDESIYNVNSSWQDQNGKTVRLRSLRGKVQVVAMVYTHCDYACPRILADLKRIRDGLSGDALKSTNFTIVSIDPERDTPGRLKEFANENDLNDQQWTLLHGNGGDILELAALFGFKYKRISDTDFTHSNLITVLNKEGEIVYQRNQLVDQPTETIKQIKKLAAQ